MKSRMCVGFLISMMAAFPLFAADPIGTIIALEGNASVTGQDGVQRALALKSPIYLNDKVITTAGSKLQIAFKDDSLISQGEKSELLVDEYVFSPGNAQDNSCSINMMKGMFRVITGKITKMNPERFRVRTKMATIGIRGCDVGFVVTEKSANVYVISLKGQESITVIARDQVGSGEWDGLVSGKWEDPEVAKQHLVNVTKDNRVISITQGEGTPVEKILTPDELAVLIEAVTPDDAPATGTTPDGTGPSTDGTMTDTGTTPTEQTTADPLAVNTSPADPVTTDPVTTDPIIVDPINLTDSVSGTMTTLGTDPVIATSEEDVNNLTEDSTQDTTTTTILNETTTETTTDTTSSSGGTTLDTTTTPTEPPYEPTETFTPVASGTDWSWGSWAVDGMLDRVELTQNNLLSPADCQAIMAQATTYNLMGAGSAGAVLKEGGVAVLVQGSCNMYVTIGGGAFPNWSGSFAMQNGPENSLSFASYGTIASSGALQVDLLNNLQGFSMRVNNGTTYTKADTWTFDGNLHGPSGAVKPTGVSGHFTFGAGGATAQGVYGTDLN